MVLIFLDPKNPQCISRSSIRTVQGAILESINVEEPAMAKALEASGIYGLGCQCGKGINLFGTGINTFGKGLVPVCNTTQEHLDENKHVFHGMGVGSWFKKTGNKVFTWSKENILPFLMASAKEALKNGKRIGADVVADVAPHVATMGAQYIDKRFGNDLVGNIAQQGLAIAGKTAQKRASDYVKEQGKAYTGTENRIADEIAKRSLAELNKLQAKKTTGKGLPNRYIQDRVLN